MGEGHITEASALLAAARWEAALDALAPPARAGDAAASRLLVEIAEAPPAPLPARLRAAALLAESGDPRRLDVATGRSALGGYWCRIKREQFWFGDSDHEQLRFVTQPAAFLIGRYLVTRAEYGGFIADGGYRQRRWWTEEGWRHVQASLAGWLEVPLWWDGEGSVAHANLPVAGLSWYEAAAYCAWLTERGRGAGWLSRGAAIRLPTSAEWTRAARHNDHRRYPWGDAVPDAERANYQGAALVGPSAVGCFPAGAAACGALDMAGNLMEWMSTAYAPPDGMGVWEPLDWEPLADAPADTMVLRSASMCWSDSAELRCGARDWGPPSGEFASVGLRLVWSPAPIG